jgi:hypothetical protein
MRRARILRWSVVITLLEIGLGSGCVHNHYYGYPQSPCDPPPAGTIKVGSTAPATTLAPGAVAYGSFCEVTPITNAATLNATGPGSRIVAAAPRPSRVLVSEPADEGFSIRPSRSGWRRTDPEAIATTKVEGAIDSPTTR